MPEIVSVTVTGKHTAQVVLTNTGADLGQADNFSYILSTTLLSEAEEWQKGFKLIKPEVKA